MRPMIWHLPPPSAGGFYFSKTGRSDGRSVDISRPWMLDGGVL